MVRTYLLAFSVYTQGIGLPPESVRGAGVGQAFILFDNVLKMLGGLLALILPAGNVGWAG